MKYVILTIALLNTVHSFARKKSDLIGRYSTGVYSVMELKSDTIASDMVLLGNDSFFIVDFFRVKGQPNDLAYNIRKGVWEYHKEAITMKFTDGSQLDAAFEFFDVTNFPSGEKSQSIKVQVGDIRLDRSIEYFCDPVPKNQRKLDVHTIGF